MVLRRIWDIMIVIILMVYESWSVVTINSSIGTEVSFIYVILNVGNSIEISISSNINTSSNRTKVNFGNI